MILRTEQLIDISRIIVLLAAADAELLAETFNGDPSRVGVGLRGVAIVKIADVVGVGTKEPQTGKECEGGEWEEGERKKPFPRSLASCVGD